MVLKTAVLAPIPIPSVSTAAAVKAGVFLKRMPLNVSWGERNERLPVEAVTGNFLSMLELPPAAGRAFRDDDDSTAGGRVAMVWHRW
jgi:hypothetical protein